MKIGIQKKDLDQSIKSLTIVLANENLLYIKTRNFHWNVMGPSFMEIHKLFEDQYNDLAFMIDEVAERIKKLGGHAIGTMKEFLSETTLTEVTNSNDRDEMIAKLLADHETMIREIREFVTSLDESNDYGTVDFLTGLIMKHETHAWMLRKYLK